MWTGVIDSVVLAIDIKKSDPLTVYFDAFAFARWDVICPGDGDKIAHREVSTGSFKLRLQSHQEPS